MSDRVELVRLHGVELHINRLWRCLNTHTQLGRGLATCAYHIKCLFHEKSTLER